MRILDAPIHCRENTIDEDNEVAHAIRYAGMFDKVNLALPSHNAEPNPLRHTVVQYAIANAHAAKLGIIVQQNLWPYWLDVGGADAPMDSRWYVFAIESVKGLAEKVCRDGVRAQHALNGAPMCQSPQLWLRDDWDESKRPAIDAAIRTALMRAGPVHYISPSSSLGPEKWTWSCAELGISRICRKTYRLQPHEAGVWLEPQVTPRWGHAYRRDVRGLWVTAAEDGKCTGRDGKSRRVLTVAEAWSCPEDSYWNITDGEHRKVLAAIGELE